MKNLKQQLAESLAKKLVPARIDRRKSTRTGRITQHSEYNCFQGGEQYQMGLGALNGQLPSEMLIHEFMVVIRQVVRTYFYQKITLREVMGDIHACR